VVLFLGDATGLSRLSEEDGAAAEPLLEAGVLARYGFLAVDLARLAVFFSECCLLERVGVLDLAGDFFVVLAVAF
jgi:hypothetical protein